jgi:putative peptidoglycan lipid II flippase
VAEALAIWACSLTLQGVGVLLSQAFFSLGRPWVTTAVAGIYVVVNAGVGLALYRPLGISGVVAGTVVANVVMVVAKAIMLRPYLGHLEGRRTLSALIRMLIAGAALGGISFGLWTLLDHALGSTFAAQLVAVGSAIAVGAAAYAGLVVLLGVPESRQVGRHLAGLMPGRR